jgi:hypothetical protein
MPEVTVAVTPEEKDPAELWQGLLDGLKVVPGSRIELLTQGFSVLCSTD